MCYRKKKFLQAQEELASFVSSNQELINQYQSLVEASAKAELALKEHVRENREDITAGDTTFQFIPAYKKWIDYNEAVNAVGNHEKIDTITTVHREVNFDEFVRMCREGIFPEDALQKAYMEKELTPRVKIINQ